MLGQLVSDDAAAMAYALQQAALALGHDDVPVGAVIVRDGVVVAARHNERELTGDPTAHAEILAIRDAAELMGNWRLENCTLYVTLEPCAMCAGAAVNSRVARVVYGATDPKAGAGGSLLNVLADPRLNHRCLVESGVMADECATVLKQFFVARRNTVDRSVSADAGDETS
jgi:tRNA(adenine34) deaminase